MPYKKNDSKINRNGRPKGSPNKTTTDLRERIGTLLENNFDKLQEDFDKLDSEKRLIVLERYLRYCLPPLQSLNIQADVNNTAMPTEIRLIRVDTKETDVSYSEQEIIDRMKQDGEWRD
jgi:hypothetical protein